MDLISSIHLLYEACELLGGVRCHLKVIVNAYNFSNSHSRVLLISNASRRGFSFFLSVELSQPYVPIGHTSAFISRVFIEIGMP